ncbi:Co2+/Mg2+ efflux protein ApaG [Deinococcus peraridilitoris]|nr:Co2+/Mg2+ efflux protein ApaG [Deinococcus peraridilitoris]
MIPDIRVSVRVHYAPGHSTPGRHVFVYHIRIENHAEESYQLIEREWQIYDGNGQVTQVQGEGVVGEQPLLRPGGVFEYNSFTSLSTAPGHMAGTYTFRDAWGERFRVPIAAFALTLPEVRTLN